LRYNRLEFQSYYDEKIEQKVKEIEDRIGKKVFAKEIVV
jgi:hypothetical protein